MDSRERIVQLVGGLANEVRDLVDGQAAAQPEVPNVMMFYFLADSLWLAAVTTNRPVHPRALVTGLNQLRARCYGVLAPFRPRVDRALAEAQALEWEYRIA